MAPDAAVPHAPLGPGSRAFDLRADGLALRGALRLAPDGGAGRGLALLLQGRTEFAEKYAPVADALSERGFATATLDWRGQGASARLLANPRKGHVEDFAAYQRDLAALIAHPDVIALCPPRLAVAHSMGGAIALRAALNGALNPDALVFSAPMWGLAQSRASAGVARFLARAIATLGGGGLYAPGNADASYAATDPSPNVLTGDPEQAAWMAALTRRCDDRALGGVTWGWLRAAYREMAALAPRPLGRRALVVAGDEEAVTALSAMRARAARDGLNMVEVPGGRHELMFETPPRREAFWRAVDTELAAVGV
jgi:lysophospholipase